MNSLNKISDAKGNVKRVETGKNLFTSEIENDGGQCTRIASTIATASLQTQSISTYANSYLCDSRTRNNYF